MRTFVAAFVFTVSVALCSPSLAAQTYPIPYVNNPLVPGSAAPEGQEFTLTLNGANFAAGDVVKWNGSPLQTNIVSNSQLTADVPSANIASAGTIFVTVSNANGGTSNYVLFDVTPQPIASLAFRRTDLTSTDLQSLEDPFAITAADFADNGTPYLAITNLQCAAELECAQEHSSITFSTFSNEGLPNNTWVYTGEGPKAIGVADFTGNGAQDLITLNEGTYSILLGNLEAHTYNDYALPEGSTNELALGDFNGDGYVDFAVSSSSGVNVFLGNGDGTFAAAVPYGSGITAFGIVTGDFNGDGILDLAVPDAATNSVDIFQGNGDGTFHLLASYPLSGIPGEIVAADFNHDGHLDLAVAQATVVSVLLGNGDGTFQAAQDYPAGTSIAAMSVGDYNADGLVDLALVDNLCGDNGCPATGSVNVLLGNRDGSFQSQLDFADGGAPVSIATAELAYDDEQGYPVGRPGFAVVNNDFSNSGAAPTVSTFVPVSAAENSLPTISSISPASATVNSSAFALTVNGTNFTATSQVTFAGENEPTTYVNPEQLTVAIPAGALTMAGTFAVTVVNPGGASTVVTFEVDALPPVILSLDPPSVIVGGPAFTLTVDGQNFVNGTDIAINGAAVPTTFVNSTQLTTNVATSAIANAGSLSITVIDPPQTGGEASGAMSLQVLSSNAQPTLGALSPPSVTAGAGNFTLTITGTNFTAGSTVTFNSVTVSSAFESATELEAAIPAALVAVAGTPIVTVANPGGAPSLATSFIVNNPLPSLGSIAPTVVGAGSAATTMTLSGANFNASSKVLVNGASRTTTYVSANSLQAALPASDFSAGGTLNITVNNPTPGGGTSAVVLLTVLDFNVSAPAPTQQVSAGQPATFSLTVAPASGTFSNAIVFSVSGLPAGATSSFSPSATIAAGSKTTSVTLSIATTPHSSALPAVRPEDRPWRHTLLWVSCFALAFAILARRRKFTMPARKTPARARTARLLPATLIFAAVALLGCGSGSSGNGDGPSIATNPSTGTPAGTYTIVVTATSGTASLNTNLTLTVM